MERPFFKSRSFEKVRKTIIESAKTRRRENIQVNYFRAPESVVRLHVITGSVDDPRFTDEERATAIQLLAELDQRQKDIIQSLPAIEEGATVGERFASFCDYDDFRNLDLDRSDHADGDWTAADRMQFELDDLLENVSLYFDVDHHELLPENCTMNLHAISEDALNSGLLWLTRNTKKASIEDGSGEVHINKRSEFICDLSKLQPEIAEFIKEKIRNHISGNAYMIEPMLFGIINDLVFARDESLTPIYSTLYAYRDMPTDDRSDPKFTEPQMHELENGAAKYPELAAEWVRLHGQGEDPRRPEYMGTQSDPR